jgi:hypothetical protein
MIIQTDPGDERLKGEGEQHLLPFEQRLIG